MEKPIRIPDDAPFTPDQRVWLAEFLSKMLEGTALGNTGFSSGPSVPVTVLYGSQTGTGEGLAKHLVKILKKGNFEPVLQDMSGYEAAQLAAEKNVLIIVSTYGDGEPPDSAADLHGWLLSDRAPALPGLSYSVLALGDSSYPDFCKCGIDFDERLADLGAKRILPRVESDVEVDEPFSEWSTAVIGALSPATSLVDSTVTAGAGHAEEIGFSKKNPFPSPVLRHSNLNKPGLKQTEHLELSLEGSGLTYEVGDALGVVPQNDGAVVDEIISLLPFRPGLVPTPDGREVPLRDALLRHYDIGTINKSLIARWQAHSGSPFLRSLVEADDRAAYDKFCWGRDLIDLVTDHPADFSDGEEFVRVLRKLQPRLYSIASSPRAHPGEVHLCVGVIRYDTFGRRRGGICSTFLAERLGEEARPGVFVHVNKAFRLPSDPSTDIIMVGPGTGIAPFRAFLEDRATGGGSGRNWLFFGNPHRASDFLYQEEIERYHENGTLDRLDLAWSRDQKEKVYVQDLMRSHGAELWNWLKGGASFYVCGDASRMAKDVDAALLEIVETHGGMNADEAKEFVSGLKKEKRYLRDVY